MKELFYIQLIILFSIIICFAQCKKGEAKSEETIIEYQLNGTGGSGSTLIDLSFADKNIGFIASGYDYSVGSACIFKTTDGGEHWQKNPVRINGKEVSGFSSIYAKTRDSIFATFGDKEGGQGVCFSKDGGSTWIKLNSTPNGHTIGVWFLTANQGFVCNGNINKTEDGGNLWQEIHNANSFLSKIFFVTNLVGFAYGGIANDYSSIGTLVKTTDGGNTWQESSLHELITSIEFIDSQIGYAFTYENKVYKTTDGGEHWRLLNDRLQGLYFFSAVKGKVKYFASGRNLYKTDDDFKTFSTVFEISDYNIYSWCGAVNTDERTSYFLTPHSIIKITLNN